MEIAGGLIANAEVDAEGKLTDKGKVYVEAGSIVVKTLHDYDNGKSFGLGVSLSKKTSEDGKTKYGVGLPVVYGFNDRARDILPTIGGGEIKVAGTSIADTSSTNSSSNNNSSNNSTNIPGLNRNIHNHIGQTEGERASLKASIPVSDIFEGLSSLSKPKGGVGAGDEPVTLGDCIREGIENIKSWFGGGEEDKEPATKVKRVVNNRELTTEEKQQAYNTLEQTLPHLNSKTASKQEKEAAAQQIDALNLPDNYSSSLSKEQLVHLISLSVGKPISINPIVTEITGQVLSPEQQGIIKQALNDVGLVLNKASKNIAKFEQKHPVAAALIEGQIEAFNDMIFPFFNMGIMAISEALNTKSGKELSKFVDKNITTPLFSMAGINPSDEEYQTGKLVLKTAGLKLTML